MEVSILATDVDFPNEDSDEALLVESTECWIMPESQESLTSLPKHCSNCLEVLAADTCVEFFAGGLHSTPINVYEGIQSVFKFNKPPCEALPNFFKLCISCGHIIAKILELIAEFRGASTIGSLLYNVINNQPKLELERIAVPNRQPNTQCQTECPKTSNDVVMNSLEKSDYKEIGWLSRPKRQNTRLKSFDLDYDLECHTEMDESSDSSLIEDDNQTNAPFECKKCDVSFSTRKRFDRHLAVHRAKLEECPFCKLGFVDRDGMLSHVMRIHPDQNHMVPRKRKPKRITLLLDEDKPLLETVDFKCGEVDCSTLAPSFPCLKDWVIHQRDVHRIISFGYKNGLDEEPLRPMSGDIRPCPTCGKRMKSDTQTINHIKATHLGDRPFSCDLCDLKFSVKQTLELHKNNIHSDKEIGPDGKAITEYTNERRAYLCTLCGATLKNKRSFENHELLHQGKLPRPFSCPICSKAFPRIHDLKAHEMIHSTVKPYLCCHCGKDFKTKKLCNSHVKSVHIRDPEQCVNCDVCGAKFGQRAHLRNHLIAIHKIEPVDARIKAGIKEQRVFQLLPNGDIMYKSRTDKKVSRFCTFCDRIFSRNDRVVQHLMQMHGKTQEEAKEMTNSKSQKDLDPVAEKLQRKARGYKRKSRAKRPKSDLIEEKVEVCYDYDI